MASIDEAIAQEKELSGHCKRMFDDMNEVDKLSNKLLKNEIEYHEQLAEWLEDYKRIKMFIPLEQALKAEYNKAIDDFVKMAYEELLYSEHLTEIDIDYIAEQLKAGASDGNG